jgi:thiol-disulfide isomerase/thioredoxin/predicted Zn-dependent protease
LVGNLRWTYYPAEIFLYCSEIKEVLFIVKKHTACSCVLGALIAGLSCSAQGSDRATVQEIFYNHDSYAAATLAQKLYAEHPSDPAARAWFAVLGKPEKAQGALAAMRKNDADGAWTLLARSKFASPWESKVLCDAAIHKAPDDVDILVLATQQMISTLHAATDHEQWIAFRANLSEFLVAHRAAYEKSAHTLAARAAAEFELAKNSDASADKKAQRTEAAAIADRALQLDPNEVEAILVKSESLIEAEEKQAGYELLHAAVGKNDRSADLWSTYLKALFSAPSLSKREDQRKQIVADIQLLLAHGEPSTSLITSLAYGLEPAGTETTATVGDLILKRYPETAAADKVLYMQATQDNPAIASDPNTTEKAHAIEAFLDRPQHHDDDTVDQARRALLYVESNLANPDLDRTYKELLAVQSESYFDVDAIATLAEHKYQLSALQKMVETHLDQEWAPFVRRTLDQTDKTGFLDFSLDYFVSPWQSVLGLIYYKEGKLQEAQQKLEASIALSPKSMQTHLRLGAVYEALGENDKAEKSYLTALSLVSVKPGEHPAVDALRKNYARQHPGDTEGLDSYMQAIVKKDADRRRESVLNARNRSPKEIPAFTLKTLDGKTMSSAELKGKVIVINFWATWCGPCREELPGFEKLYQQYSHDLNVVILSVATDSLDTPVQTIATYIHAHKFNFPVLLGPSYAEENSATPIPMTWFIDPSSHEIYRKVGYTKELEQEFGWRIEALRNTAATIAVKPTTAVN